MRKAIYYGREIDVVGHILAAKLEKGEVLADFKVGGTQDEAFLRAMSGKSDRVATLHICPADCPQTVTGETYVHGWEYETISGREDDWFTNLEAVSDIAELEDENRRLREAMAKEAEEGSKDEDTPKEKKAKKKEKSKKEKKEKKEKKASGSKKKKEDSSSDPEERVLGQRKPEELYTCTGLDPETKPRGKVLRKAKRIGEKNKKKKKKSSKGSQDDSSSSEDTSTDEDVTTGLFSADRKIRSISTKCPGALAFTSLMEARQNLLTTAGMSWGMEKKEVSPIFVQYTRQQMSMGMAPAMLQEAMTVSTSIDLLLANRPAAAADVLCQRLKALESLYRGSHWTVARQLELVRTEQLGLTQENEGLEAARRAKQKWET